MSVNVSYTPKNGYVEFNSMQFTFSDGAKSFVTTSIGDRTGTNNQNWVLGKSSYVTQGESISRGGKLAGLIFRTNDGARSPTQWSTSN